MTINNFKNSQPLLSPIRVVGYFKWPILETSLNQCLYGAGNPWAALIYEAKQGWSRLVTGWQTMLPCQ